MRNNLTTLEYVTYLEMVGHDMHESGMNATADDYLESAKRIQDLVDQVLRLDDVVMTMKKEIGK